MTTASAQRLDATFAALADPTRRAIVARLAHGEATVNELAAPFAISLPGISKHLKVLESCGLISRSRQATFRPCRLERQALDEAVEWIEESRRIWTQRFDKLDDHLRDIQNDRAPEAERKVHMNDPTTAAGELSFTRVFDAPRELVFQCLTEPEHLTHFWGPAGTSAPLESIKVDARPGGVFETVMVNDADGSTYPDPRRVRRGQRARTTGLDREPQRHDSDRDVRRPRP